jgi:hypothetical protein
VPLDARRADGCPVRRRWAGGMGAAGSRKVGKMCALSALSRRPAARGSRCVVRGGVAAGSAEAWGSFSGRQTRVLPLDAAVGWAVYRMVTCLRSRLRTFPLADSKDILWGFGAGSGRWAEGAGKCFERRASSVSYKKPIDKGFRTRDTLFYCPPQVARGNFV